MRSIINISFLILLLSPHLIDAQIANKRNSCNQCRNGEHHHIKPYDISFKKEIPYFATGLGLTLSGLYLMSTNAKDEFTVNDLNQLNRQDINSFDRPATYKNSASARLASDYMLYGSVILPIYFLSNHNTKKDFFPLLIMGAEVMLLTNTISFNTKFAVNRTRPTAYNENFSIEERLGKTNTTSFFSGHTAQTAAFSVYIAKVMTDYHPDMKTGYKVALWSFGLGLPAATGLFRVEGGRHFYTDVMVGYGVGALVGWLVPQLHKKKNANLSLVPYNHNGMNGFTFTVKL